MRCGRCWRESKPLYDSDILFIEYTENNKAVYWKEKFKKMCFRKEAIL